MGLRPELDINQQMVKRLRVGQNAEALVDQPIQHPDGEMLVGPPASHVLRAGDRLMLLSTEDDMDTLGRTKEKEPSLPREAEQA